MLFLAATLGFVAALAVAALLLRLGFPLPDAKGRSQSVDGLRGLLACAVAIHHMVIWFGLATGRGWTAPESPLLNQFGAGSVALFLMVTGWLIWPKLVRGMSGKDWVLLYVGRALRILPMVALALGAVIVLAWVKSGVALKADQPPGLLLWLFGLDLPPIGGVRDAARINASVFWYLGQEWFFCVVIVPLLALVLWAGKRLATPALLLAPLLLCAWAVSIAFPLSGEGYFVWASPYAFRLFLPVLLSGMMIAALLKMERLNGLIGHPVFGWASLALFLGTISLARFPYGWALPGLIPFLLCVASGKHYGAVLSARPVVLLGNLSFSIYVMHPELLYALFGFDGTVRGMLAGLPAVVTVPVVMVAVALLAALIHHLIERPSLVFAGRVRSAIEGVGVRPRVGHSADSSAGSP